MFNLDKPPFDNPKIRQAFAAATDRSAVVALIEKYRPELKPRVAETLTPPEILGVDLTGYVGFSYNPQKAKELLAEAGYSDLSAFPPVTIFTQATGAGEYPGLPLLIIEAVADSWRNALGIEVIISATNETLKDRLASNPPDVFRPFGSWAADYNDPDNFVGELFNPDGDYNGDYNYSNFSDPTFNALVNKAAESKNPALRQELYIQGERILVEGLAAIIPLYWATYNPP